jgi:hypothetical protein
MEDKLKQCTSDIDKVYKHRPVRRGGGGGGVEGYRIFKFDVVIFFSKRIFLF